MTLFSIAFNEDQKKRLIVSALFIKKDISTKVSQFKEYEENLYQVDFPIDEVLNPSTSFPLSPSPSLNSKIYLIAGAIFFLLATVVFIAVKMSNQGALIGNGMHLTAAELGTLLVGTTGSLTLVAIGSYKWWKEGQATKKVSA